MSEVNDYKTFKKNVQEPKDRIDRVESNITGLPDINYCFEGVEGWIELKSPVEPVKETTKLFGSNHKVGQDQKNWFATNQRAGGRGYILISTDKRWLLFPQTLADFINDMTVRQLSLTAIWEAKKPVREKELWKQLRMMLMR